MSSGARNPIIVALDFDDSEAALRCARSVQGAVGMFKVGLELFCRTGPEFVRRLAQECGPVFLDLKFHDIPNTVAGAVRSVCLPGVELITVHAAGGEEMLRAAVEAAQGRVRVLGVTVLTSLDRADLLAVGVDAEVCDQVLRLVALGVQCGLDGFVCSPTEVSLVRAAAGKSKVLVTPGVRPAGGQLGDQKRTATAGEAMAAGADYLVIGRPITRAADPLAVVREILTEVVRGV